MKKNILVLLGASLVSSFIWAQDAKKTEVPPIVFKGKITFERKLNLHKQMEGFMKEKPEMASMMEMMKKNTPKYRTDVFELTFTDKASLYKPAPNGIQEIKNMMANLPAEKNIVYNNYEKEEFVAEKNIFEKQYLISDSLKQYEWKITDEFRKVAGFNCRRAETIIMDSVYVIAFYTDAILAQGGPEGFSGLPGMILGVVLPRMNMTYFATSFDNYVTDEATIVAPTKGSKKKLKDLEEEIKESTKQWGDFAQRILWYVNL
jgi:GLPGLI family protein